MYELMPIEPRQPMAGAKAGYCATPVTGSIEVHHVGVQQMHTMASQVGDRAHEVRRQLPLDGEVPLLNIRVLAVPLFGIR